MIFIALGDILFKMEKEQETANYILEEDSFQAPTDKEEIIYYRPKFHRRVLANLLDAILLIFLTAGLFLLNRFIVSQTPTYKRNMETLEEIKLDSGLFREESGNRLTDVISYLNSDTNYNTEAKKNEASASIDKFLAYAKEKCSEEDYAKIVKDYDDFRLASSMTYVNSESPLSGTALFVKNSDGVIVENSVFFESGAYAPSIYSYYYTNAYSPYIDNHCQAFLTTTIPQYYDLTKYFALMLIFADALPAYLLSGILVYYIPMICFTRGRTTLGKALYRVGLVDRRVLSPRFGRITARFAIFFFGELCLSLVTFGLPFILSFSLMAFSKNKQGFPDYMLGLTEIDMYRTKIYKSFDEADLDKVNSHKKPVDFRMKNFD